VLVVDDEPDIVTVCEINLELAGYAVSSAPNGPRALQQAIAEQPDLILLDVRMPQMDGLAVLDRLRSTAETAAIPVILLTAQAVPKDQLHGRADGAAEWLMKPFDPAVLVRTVRRVLQTAGDR
jgi:CheY-like chemotaxis protein